MPRSEKPDLSHWDHADEFTGREAACLILGIEPSEASWAAKRMQPVLDNMERSYVRAQYPHAPESAPRRSRTVPPLASVQLTHALTALDGDDSLGWLEGPLAAFDQQRFTRQALADWVAASQVGSEYAFAQTCAASDSAGRDDEIWSPRSRRTHLAVIAGQSRLLKFDPDATRSKHATDIERVLEAAGMRIGAETVLKVLREASELVRDAKKRK